jgi:hypothetical protein
VSRVIPISVVELPEFQKDAAKLLTEEQILELVTEIATNPGIGQVVANTGGIRKLRFAPSGRGKRGGARVIYVYYCEDIPVFILACYAKNRKADLTEYDKKTFRTLVLELRRSYEAGVEERLKQAKKQQRSTEENETERDQGRPQA